MKNEIHQLRFWGVRGSIPTADSDKDRIGGDTSCVEFAPANGTHIVFDGGTGIRGLGNHIGRLHNTSYDIHLFLSHTHWDHIIGLPFFAPLHQPFANILIYGPKRAGNSLESNIRCLFTAPFFPLELDKINANLTFIELDTGRYNFSDGAVVHCTSHPHPNGAMSYRVEVGGITVAYVTDIEHHKEKLVPSVVELCRDADALVHDSHFHREDLPFHRSWGHSSWEECTTLAREARVKSLYLFHYSPNYTDFDVFDMEQRAREDFPHTTAAYQGLTVDFTAP